jgi:hypothetical protein
MGLGSGSPFETPAGMCACVHRVSTFTNELHIRNPLRLPERMRETPAFSRSSLNGSHQGLAKLHVTHSKDEDEQ